MEVKQKGAVVAIGNFDGVHAGHAALIACARALSQDEGIPLVALTFEPHPRQFFMPDIAPFRITPEALKAKKLAALGVGHVAVIPFDAALAGLSAQGFIDEILVARFCARHVVVGPDFHFGHKRGGRIETLLADPRFKTHSFALRHQDDAPVSSTRVREAIKAGDMDLAALLLGWRWMIEGVVVHGDKRGRTLGYPTANIPLGDTICPAYGIYAVRVDIGDGVWRFGAASIGVRPMFEVKTPLLEVFLLDFDGDLYGRTLRVEPVRKLRDEVRFESLEALTAQMALDVAKVREIL